MSSLKYNIFKKNSDVDKNTVAFKNDIINSIPDDAKSSEDENLINTKTETRWRIFEYTSNENKNKFLEISMKKPNEPRLFLNHYGKWIEADENQYDQYKVIKKYYAYI